MKKIMSIAAFALIAMACNKVENIVENKLAIGFSAEVGKGTKAPIEGTTFGEQLSFGVYSTSNKGTDIPMNNVKISHDVTAWRAEGSVKYYWPNDASTTLDFYAYHPHIISNISFTKLEGIKIANYKNDFETDLMYATPVLSQKYETNGGVVPVKFNHALTQIFFNVKSGEADGVTLVVNSIKLLSIPNTGNFAAKTNTWTAMGAPETIEIYNKNNNPGHTVKSASEKIGKTVLVIPQTSSALKFEVVYTVSGDRVADETVTKSIEFGNDWKANQKISYNLTIGMKEITFNPSIIDWAPITVVGK